MSGDEEGCIEMGEEVPFAFGGSSEKDGEVVVVVHVVAVVGLTYLLEACPVPHLGLMNSPFLGFDPSTWGRGPVEDLLSLVCRFSKEACSNSVGSLLPIMGCLVCMVLGIG